MPIRAKIKGVGSYLPETILTNDALAKTLDTSDEWIVSRSGIRQRHIVAEGQVTSDLALAAAQRALEDAELTPRDIDVIIVATTTPDRTFPSTATYLQAKLGMTHGAGFDVQAVCSGFIYAMSVATAMIETEQARTILVVGADSLSRILDWNDRATAVLFGDGAGALILRGETGAMQEGVLGNHIRSDGRYADLLYTDGGASYNQQVGVIDMNGREVFRHAVTNIAESITTLLEKTNHEKDAIDWFVPHQANLRIIRGVAKKIGIDEAKTVVTIDRHANTSAASIPLAFDELMKSGRAKAGALVMFEAMGGGLTWGASLVRL